MDNHAKVAAMSFHRVLGRQHCECDIALAAIEQAALDDRWPDAGRTFDEFIAQTEEHFAYEEYVLFPALQQANPMTTQPVAVMLSDHAQIRELASDMQIAIGDRRLDLLQGTSETLMFLLQQHNAKEENVLYPIADQLLDSQRLLQQRPNAGRA